MRKFMLISAFISTSMLASASVQAQGIPGGIPGGINAPGIEDAGPEGAGAQGASRQQGARKQASSPKKAGASRRETDEQKARRIGAQYGVSW
jgi:hypothetical protein